MDARTQGSPCQPFLGSTHKAVAVRRDIERATTTRGPVLISGEVGVGKTFIARQIYLNSGYSLGDFVHVDCTRIPESRIEAHLFGDCVGRVGGAIREADNGVLCLEEVGALSSRIQHTLHSTVQEARAPSMDSPGCHAPHCLVISTSRQDLSSVAQQREFDTRLLQELRVIEVIIPPLRERRDDIPEMASRLAREIAMEKGRPFDRFTAEALEELKSYDWPGNIGQLIEVIHAAFDVADGAHLDAVHVLPAMLWDPIVSPLQNWNWRKARRNFERAYVVKLLQSNHGNVRLAAIQAGVTRRSFYKILRRLDISITAFSGGNRTRTGSPCGE